MPVRGYGGGGDPCMGIYVPVMSAPPPGGRDPPLLPLGVTIAILSVPPQGEPLLYTYTAESEDMFGRMLFGEACYVNCSSTHVYSNIILNNIQYNGN